MVRDEAGWIMPKNDCEAVAEFIRTKRNYPLPNQRSRTGGDAAMTEPLHPSISALHKQWVKLENEHHELAMAIDRASGADLTAMCKRQARLLLKIGAVVAAIQDAPGTTVEDFVALLDVALEHELDLASDIAFYGPTDYPMTARLLRALACKVPGFEFTPSEGGCPCQANSNS